MGLWRKSDGVQYFMVMFIPYQALLMCFHRSCGQDGHGKTDQCCWHEQLTTSDTMMSNLKRWYPSKLKKPLKRFGVERCWIWAVGCGAERWSFGAVKHRLSADYRVLTCVQICSNDTCFAVHKAFQKSFKGMQRMYFNWALLYWSAFPFRRWRKIVGGKNMAVGNYNWMLEETDNRLIKCMISYQKLLHNTSYKPS